MKTKIVIALLFAIFAGLAISSMLQQSGTCDEIAHHIPVGVVMLTKGDLKLDTSQPPLSRYIIALPVVLFLNPRLPQNRAEWRTDDRASFGRDFFFKYNNHPKQMLFASRLMIVFVGLLCGLVVFLWSRSLFGLKTALFSLFLYVFSPDILAHTQLATTDMMATFFMLLSLYIFWRFVNNQNNFNFAAAGITLGLAQLSKYSAIILYPILIVLAVIHFRNSKYKSQKSIFLKLLLIFFISFLVIWAGYGFSLKPILKDAVRAEEKIEFIDNRLATFFPSWDASVKNKVNNFLLHTPIPLGEHVLGIFGVIKHSKEGHAKYFLGQWSAKGNILYFIVAFFIKTPIPLLILLICGIFNVRKNTSSLNKYFLIIPPLIYFIAALFSNLQIGVRHLLPIYPFCFILAANSVYTFTALKPRHSCRGLYGAPLSISHAEISGFGSTMLTIPSNHPEHGRRISPRSYGRLHLLQNKIFKMVFTILCAWYIAGCFFIWPHYLSYFNEFAAGSDNGWKYLRDSNIDWGQDLPALAKYLEKNNVKEITFLYFGEDNPKVYDINFHNFSKEELGNPGKKTYAISVQYLDSITWTKNLSPTAKAGYSIFIYDFRK